MVSHHGDTPISYDIILLLLIIFPTPPMILPSYSCSIPFVKGNVNPGLIIFQAAGCLIRKWAFEYQTVTYYDYWRSKPLINKPWFSLVESLVDMKSRCQNPGWFLISHDGLHQDGSHTVTFKLRPDSPLEKMMNAWCKNMQVHFMVHLGGKSTILGKLWQTTWLRPSPGNHDFYREIIPNGLGPQFRLWVKIDYPKKLHGECET